MRRRITTAATIAALLLVLAGCAGLPTSGPVNPGLSADQSVGDPDIAFRPDSPQPGATPEEIVDGFIRAGTGPGQDGTWAVAREYLAPGFEKSWDPRAGVTIDEPGARVYTSATEDQVALSLTRIAAVDEIGDYERTGAEATRLEFRLAVQSDGEWRITDAPDGLVLDTSQFSRVFSRYALMYFDPTWEFLVPDVRWFPVPNAATYIADALVDGPVSPWLAASVVTAFPESVSLRPSVPVVDGVAQVELDAAALELSPETLSRMEAQLTASLEDARVSDVQMSAGSTVLDVDPAPTRSTRVAPSPLVLTAEGLGFLTGDDLTPVQGLTEAMTAVDPVSIQLSPDRDFAAVRLSGGGAARVEADGDVLGFDERPGLIDPAVDPSGYSWSVPRSSPAALAAFAPGSERVDIAGAWPDATEITSMALSRDGTRLVAVVTTGGGPAVWVSGVIRDSGGLPSALGEPLVLQGLPTPDAAVAWLDDTTIGVLVRGVSEPEVVEIVVGGPATGTTAPPDAAQIAGTNGVLRVSGRDGALYAKRGSTWPQTATGVIVLATQQGSPR